MQDFLTPIIHLCSNNNKLYVKRDDLLPFSFGGNKVRIADELYKDMLARGGNCMIGYGNSRSNLCRALANMSFRYNSKCIIISPSDEDGNHIQTLNSLMIKQMNIDIIRCNKNNVKKTVIDVINKVKDSGHNPYYIYGNEFGKGNEDVLKRAYEKVYCEIILQAKENNIDFDYIFTPCGTGMTMGGLISGKHNSNGNEEIIGISIARTKKNARNAIMEMCPEIDNDEIKISDEYLFGGYGKYDSTIVNFIHDIFLKYGMPLDPTYTGKSFYGMCNYLASHHIEGKTVLFIHTGGIPLYFDLLCSHQ